MFRPPRDPLNPYIYSSDIPAETMPARARTSRSPGARTRATRSATSKRGISYSSSSAIADPNADASTCYNDVGTSYPPADQMFFQAVRASQGNWNARLAPRRRPTPHRRWLHASRMIWLNDEYCDITMNQTSPNARVVNGYGEINKAVVAFLDGHARYLKIIPGGENDPNAANSPWLVPAYSNPEYTVVFPDPAPLTMRCRGRHRARPAVIA